MIYLLLAILCSTAIFVVMRFFSRFQIDNHQAIAWNYLTAMGIGYGISAMHGTLTSPAAEPWFSLSLLTGFWFILSYVLMIVSSQRSGVTLTSLSSKLSVVIPTLFGVFFLKEQLGWLSGIGIVLALVSLFLVVGGRDPGKAKAKDPSVVIGLLPLLIFFCTGIGDVLMKLTERANLSADPTPMIAFIYCISFLFSLPLIGYDLLKGKSKWQWKNAAGGIVLGLFNFFSTFFVYHAMRIFDNVVLFPVYNIGVVCLTAMAGLVLFKERLSWKNYVGLALAIVAVLLITLKP